MKQKAKEANTVRYPVTFPNTLHTAIKAIAADTDTSMNAIIINVLQDWIAQRRGLAQAQQGQETGR